MNIEDCLPYMSKMYLDRVLGSILREDIPNKSPEHLREKITQNLDSLGNTERILHALDLHNLNRSHRILFEEILFAILENSRMTSTEEIIFDQVQTKENDIIDRAQQKDAFDYSDAYAIDIYGDMLEAALADNETDYSEFNLLERLRKKLGITRYEHHLLEAYLGKFPKPDNELHTYSEIAKALKELQSKGILFYCNNRDDGNIVLPEEMLDGVKQALDYEMTTEAQRELQEALSSDQLKEVLKQFDLPLSGAKQDRSERLIKAQLRPSQILDIFHTNDLSQICDKLPGLKKSGAKEDKINRIIKYFDSIDHPKSPEETEDPRAISYQYYLEIANRNNKYLHKLNIIGREHEIERKFEEGTRYLFEVKLGCSLLTFEGSEHADGGLEMENGELLLWDNKSKEETYTLPAQHAKQFKTYIRNATKRVNVFLIIVPEIDPEAEVKARQLKHDNESDTDIALITARDLQYVAENWHSYSKKNKFSPKIFNYTGILDRTTLEQQMKIIL